MNDKLKRLLVYYTISGLLCAAVLSGVILVEKYRGPLYDTTVKLRRIKADLIGMKGAVDDMGRAIGDLKAALPEDFGSRLPEGLVLVGLDDIKRRIKGSDIIVKGFEEKGNELVLPVGIQGVMSDYTVFVNNVGYLESLRFPYFQVNKISISQVKGKGPAVSYVIDGIFRMPGAGGRGVK